MHLEWVSLAEVFLVAFGTAVGIIVLFSLGVAVLAPQPTGSTGSGAGGELPRQARLAVAGLCFAACVLVVGYGLYVIVAR